MLNYPILTQQLSCRYSLVRLDFDSPIWECRFHLRKRNLLLISFQLARVHLFFFQQIFFFNERPLIDNIGTSSTALGKIPGRETQT
jgi:hypothetical protein